MNDVEKSRFDWICESGQVTAVPKFLGFVWQHVSNTVTTDNYWFLLLRGVKKKNRGKN